MAVIKPNEFTSYALTDQECMEGSKLTITQTQVIQNELAIKAQELITLIPSFDPKEQNEFLYRHAYCTGAIDILKYVLGVSIALEDSLIQEGVESINNNNQN